LTDVFFTLTILIPGFVSFNIFRMLARYEKKISDNQTILWSLFFSLFIYSVFLYLTKMTDINEIMNIIFVPNYLILILTLGLLAGIIPGVMVRNQFRANIFTGDCWEASMEKASSQGSWVIVHTSDGQEFMGTLHYSGSGEDPREISIREPTKIIRKDDKVIEKEWGKEILFSENDVKRVVVFYQEV